MSDFPQETVELVARELFKYATWHPPHSYLEWNRTTPDQREAWMQEAKDLLEAADVVPREDA